MKLDWRRLVVANRSVRSAILIVNRKGLLRAWFHRLKARLPAFDFVRLLLHCRRLGYPGNPIAVRYELLKVFMIWIVRLWEYPHVLQKGTSGSPLDTETLITWIKGLTSQFIQIGELP